MGTLGSYLKNAREARGVDLHEAAQQTRINVNYLKAMEGEDFSKLPGKVFVRGFLKSYAQFLKLDEEEVSKRYQELQPAANAAAAAPEQRGGAKKTVTVSAAATGKRDILVEPIAWGASILICMMILLFVAMKETPQTRQHADSSIKLEHAKDLSPATDAVAVKLYLEIVAQEDAWVLVRTDASPQKKAILKKGESVIWSADERFLLSYPAVGSIRLLLNGNELFVKAPKGSVVRDLVITAGGIVDQKPLTEQPTRKTKPKPVAQPQPAQPQVPAASPPVQKQEETPAAPPKATSPPSLPFSQPQ